MTLNKEHGVDLKRSLASLSIFFMLLSVPGSQLRAEEYWEQSELALKTKAIVDAAYAFILENSNDMPAVQEALQNDPRFFERERQLYIFMHCYHEGTDEAICCGQGVRPELIGKNMWHLRTPTGRLLFHEIREIIERDGQGWIEYEWLNPYTNTIQTKRSYVRGIVLEDGRKAWVGCGFWKK